MEDDIVTSDKQVTKLSKFIQEKKKEWRSWRPRATEWKCERTRRTSTLRSDRACQDAARRNQYIYRTYKVSINRDKNETTKILKSPSSLAKMSKGWGFGSSMNRVLTKWVSSKFSLWRFPIPDSSLPFTEEGYKEAKGILKNKYSTLEPPPGKRLYLKINGLTNSRKDRTQFENSHSSRVQSENTQYQRADP